MPTPLHIAIAGCTGRMGKTLVRLAATNPALHLTGGSVPAGDEAAGKDIGALAGIEPLGVAATTGNLFDAAEAVIDFTTPAYTLALAEEAARTGKIHIIGTTGLSDAQKQQLRTHAQKAIIVFSANMSLGVNLLAALVEQAARALGENYHVAIFDHHHKHKVDAPSGTALMLGEATGRSRAAIAYSDERSGEVIGDHRVTFDGPEDTITFTHHAKARDMFAAGALKAALWARGKRAGFYSLRDVLGI